MNIYLASDHAGFGLKEGVKKYLISKGCAVTDFGASEYNSSDDYPDFIFAAANAVSEDASAGLDSKGIIFGYSGQGEAVMANRLPHVRSAVYYGGPRDIIILSREHNDANMLSIGAHFITLELAKEMIDLWFATEFTFEERHVRRIKEIENYATNSQRHG